MDREKGGGAIRTFLHPLGVAGMIAGQDSDKDSLACGGGVRLSQNNATGH